MDSLYVVITDSPVLKHVSTTNVRCGPVQPKIVTDCAVCLKIDATH